MLASGLANAVLVQHFVLGVFAYLLGDFGGLLKKLLFLGRTHLLRVQSHQTLCWRKNIGCRVSKRCAGASFGARDVAFAAMGLPGDGC